MKRNNIVLLAVVVILSITNLVDFVFYGQKLEYLVLALGFLLLALGTYKDNDHSSLAGAVMVICGFITKWFF